MTSDVLRIPSAGRLRDIGVVNWIICRIAARAVHAPRMHLFTVLALHKRLFWSWLPYSGVLLGFGKLPREHTELVILRTAYLRKCEYELQYHRRIAKRVGLDDDQQAAIFAGPRDPRLSYQQKALVAAVDEFVHMRTLSRAMHAWLANFLEPAQVVELCTLIGQYDALAATTSALRIPLDHTAT